MGEKTMFRITKLEGWEILIFGVIVSLITVLVVMK
jgi:hypothetical protein